MKKLLLLACWLALPLFLMGQNSSSNLTPVKIAVFIDCQTWNCDFDFFRTKLNMIDFARDRFDADVHLIINNQSTGGGGDKYFLNFSGQRLFAGKADTLSFFTEQAATNDEIREKMLRFIQLGLAPYMARTDAAQFLGITYSPPAGQETQTSPEKDPWNYWIFSFGGGGQFSGDANYTSSRFRANASANRITEASRISFWSNYSNNLSVSIYDEEEIRVRNNRKHASLEYVKSMGDHWSIGVESSFDNSNFENLKLSLVTLPQVEYSLYPYKDFNSKRITFTYGLGLRYLEYYDTTIYFKTNEVLAGQKLGAVASFTQKWGNINLGVNWLNYFHDFSINNLGAGGAIEWRVFKGLNLSFWGNYDFIHDQVSLPKGTATRDDVLTQRRLIASTFNYQTGINLRYQFGSKVNNAVNPRFSGMNYSIFY